MFIWMLMSTAFAAVLAIAARLLEPCAWRIGVPTRLLWSSVLAGTVAWTAWTATQAESNGPRRTLAAAADAPNDGTPHAEGVAGRRAPALADASSQQTSADLLLLGAWLCCSVGCVSILAFSAWRIGRLRTQWVERVVAGVPVLVSHDVGPAVVGVVHHVIVVPAWVTSLDAKSQHTIMVHEREHVRAGDPLLLWGTTALVALMPWNAVLWVALRRVRHAIEIDCDARVLRAGQGVHAYCSLLLDVSQRTLAGVAPIAALAEPSTLLERRVEAMMNTRTFGWRATAGAAAAACLVAVACRAPRPEVTPRASVTHVARQLVALLATDSGKASLASEDRARLGAALGYADAQLSDRSMARSPNLARTDTKPRSPACATDESFADTLRAWAPRMQPAAFSPVRRDSSMLVGMIVDSHCQLLYHAVGRRKGEHLDVDSALTLLFPNQRVRPWTIAGFVGTGNSPHDLWIAWAALAPSDSVR